MDEMLSFDEKGSRAIEAAYRTPDVIEQRRAILRVLGLQPGERVLDLGCGPGFLANEMAQEVGQSGLVHGIDSSASMLEIAGNHAADETAAPLELSEQDVTTLSFPDAIFDAAVSVQVYEYVGEIAKALGEARRVLVPGGRLLVLDTDWDSIVWRSNDDERMRRVLKAWDDHLAHRDLPRRLPQLLAEAGLIVRMCSVVPLLNVGYEQESYSGRLIELIAGYVAGHRALTAAEASAWAADLRALEQDYFFSLNRYMFLATRWSSR